MPDGTLDLADRLWRGEVASSEYHPVSLRGGLAEIDAGFALGFLGGEALAHEVFLVSLEGGPELLFDIAMAAWRKLDS